MVARRRLNPTGAPMNRTVFVRSASIALLVAALGGCASEIDTASWTPEQFNAYQAAKAQHNHEVSQQILQRSTQWSQQFMAQTAPAAPYQAPEIAPIGQPDDTSIVYCRDLTGNTVACRQIR
jgi:hypothetical protein